MIGLQSVFRSFAGSAATLLALIVTCTLVMPAEADRPGYPKVMNYYLTNSVTTAEMTALAQWDVLVLDADFEFQNPGGIAQMKAINPGLTVFAFAAINGVLTSAAGRPPQTVVRQYWDECAASDFWLYGEDGSHTEDFPGKYTGNLTDHCPVNGQGERFSAWLARFIDEVIWQQGNSNFDGIFLDGVFDKIAWVNNVNGNAKIDSDYDLVGDPEPTLNGWWQHGTETCIVSLRQRMGVNAPLMSNGNTALYPHLNGSMVENFPYNERPPDEGNIYDYAWQAWMFNEVGAYLSGQNNYATGPINLTTINTWFDGDQVAPDTGNPRFLPHKRFTLASTLLGDGYYSLDFAWFDHASIWWEPEYEQFIGTPTGTPYTIDNGGVELWRRDYTDAMVVVNPHNAASPAFLDMPAIDPWDAYIGPPTTATAVPDDPTLGKFQLHLASPNPFRAGTMVSYELKGADRVQLRVHDVQGRLVRTLVDRFESVGARQVQWSGRDDAGQSVPPGMYFAVLRVGNQVRTTKLLKE